MKGIDEIKDERFYLEQILKSPNLFDADTCLMQTLGFRHRLSA